MICKLICITPTLICYTRYLPCYIWHMIPDTGICHIWHRHLPWYIWHWYLPCYMWNRHLSCYIWHMIPDIGTCHAIFDTWYMTPVFDICYHLALAHLTWYCDTWPDTITLDTCTPCIFMAITFTGTWLLYYTIYLVLLDSCILVYLNPWNREAPDITPDTILLLIPVIGQPWI